MNSKRVNIVLLVLVLIGGITFVMAVVPNPGHPGSSICDSEFCVSPIGIGIGTEAINANLHMLAPNSNTPLIKIGFVGLLGKDLMISKGPNLQDITSDPEYRIHTEGSSVGKLIFGRTSPSNPLNVVVENGDVILDSGVVKFGNGKSIGSECRRDEEVGANGAISLNADCNAGEFLTGGGCNCGTNSVNGILFSEPSMNNEGVWKCKCQNPVPTNEGPMKAYAICCS